LRHETPSILPSAALAAIFAVAMASTTVSTPIYPLYEVRFGLTAVAITVVFAAYGVGVMGGLLVTGRLSDHIGRKPPLAAGLVIGLLAMGLFVAANDLGLLLAARLLIGITAGLFTGTATAWLVDLDDDRQRATKLAVGANLGGLALGPALGGVLAQFVPDPLRTTYVVELALMAVGLVVLSRLPETVPRGRFELDFAGIVPPREVRAVFVPAAMAGVAAFGGSGGFGGGGPSVLGGVPVLVAEDVGPAEALQRSADLFRQTWGEEVAGGFSFGLIFTLLALPAVALPFLGRNLGPTGMMAGQRWPSFTGSHSPS